MKRFFASLFIVCGLTAWLGALSQLPAYWQSRLQVSVGGAPAATTLNPADKDASITLSGGNLVATGGTGNVRSTVSFSSGKKYWESFNTNNSDPNSFDRAYGVANSSLVLSAFPGVTTDSVVVYQNDTVMFFNNASIGGVTPYTGVSLNVTSWAVDAGANLIWYSPNCGTTWNAGIGADPATGTGGDSIATMTKPWFAVSFGNTATASNTFNFGATAYTCTPPSGFGNL